MRVHRDVLGARGAAISAWISTLLLAVCVVIWTPCALQGDADPVATPTTPSKYEPATHDLIASRQKAVTAAKDLDEDTRAKALDFHRQADEALKAAEAFAVKAAESKRLADRATRAAAELKTELMRRGENGSAVGTTNDQTGKTRTIAALETELIEARTSLDTLARKQSDFEKEPARRANRRKEARARLLALPDLLLGLKKQRAASVPSDEPALVSLGRRTCLQAQIQSFDQELPALHAELARYDAEDAVDLVRMQRDLLVQNLVTANHRVKHLTELIDQARRAEADRGLADAKRMEHALGEDTVVHSLIEKNAQENVDLAEEARTLTKPIEAAERDLKQAEAALENWSAQFQKTKDKAERVGLNGPIGQLLRKQRNDLPDPDVSRRIVDAHSDAIDQVQFRLYELDELRSKLANPQELVKETMAKAPADLSDEQRKGLEKASREILESKRQYLDTLTRSYGNYYSTLLELVISHRNLIKLIDKYANYIDERVLWIRSSRPLQARELFRGKPIGWLLSPSNWKQVAEALGSDSRRNPLAPLGLGLLIGLFIYVRKRFKSEIGRLGHDARHSNFSRFLPTLRAFCLTLATSAAGGGVLCFVAWRLWIAAYDVDFPSAVSQALFDSAWLYIPLDFVRRSCRRDGLAEAHFGWSAGVLHTVDGDVRWLMAVGLPLVLVTDILHSADADALRNALERVLFAGGMVMTSVFLYRVLRPKTAVLRELIPSAHNDWADRAQVACRWGGVAGALLIALLVVVGYDYTARQFLWRIHLTGIALVAAYYTRALFLRWILIHRRLMGMQQVKEHRVTELHSTVAADTTVAAAVRAETIPKVDLATLSAQTRTLVNVGILTTLFVTSWWIWSDLFPSAGILNQWVLWTTVAGDAPRPITVSNLLAALFVAAMTWIAVRNIPGLLEMTVLQRLPLDTAGRFAFSTLVRYAIVVIGLATASSAIGIGWSQVQWLATALTFGLAFGLQEIFANFIAGLIILFERPIRVGDMVTVESVTGVVNRIRIRATTIINSDRKEFIVPNKEFITGRILNWTLSDTINRIVINVNVAYGSDTERAQELLLKAAHDHPAVLRDPAPSASFEEFGENGLKLVLRCFLPNVTERTRVIHELHTAINKAFATNGIEISAPSEASKPMLPLVPPRTPAPHLSRTG